MRTYSCFCGQTLYFDNDACVRCGAVVGFCPQCRAITGWSNEGGGVYRCTAAACGQFIAKCANYSEFNVCNRGVALRDDRSPIASYCDCCRHNVTIPDLSVPDNIEKWYRLEMAKRRHFYELDLLHLPYGTLEDGFDPPLQFDFKADVKRSWWQNFGEQEQVYTGHADGLITINIREADTVERERLRVDMNEPRRTLIGHFRHEMGHYYWEVFVKGQHEQDFAALFGDPYAPSYDEAMETYYERGPDPNWAQHLISAYASMHPWEDWAETFAYYLEAMTTLETACNFGIIECPWQDFEHIDRMILRYQKLGVGLNELSRNMGLLDMVPHVPTPAVIDKIRFIHGLVQTRDQETVALRGV